MPLPRPLFLGSEIYRGSSYGLTHPLRVPRVSTVMDLTRALGWLSPAQYRASPRAKPGALEIWHTPAYLAALQQAEATQTVTPEIRDRHGIGTMSNPVYAEMFRRPATAAGASLLAGELLAAGGIIHHPGGGTHHGMPDRAGGFCYLNDPVLAMLALRRAGARRIVYVDIDAHHMDGVEVGFAGDADTRLISVHEEKRWPFTGLLTDTGGGNCFNLPVPRGFNDSEMALVRDALILPATAGFAPDAVVLQCGADAVLEDPLSRLALSNNAHWAVVRALMDLAPGPCAAPPAGAWRRRLQPVVGRAALDRGLGHTERARHPRPPAAGGRGRLARVGLGAGKRGPQPARTLVHNPARCPARWPDPRGGPRPADGAPRPFMTPSAGARACSPQTNVNWIRNC